MGNPKTSLATLADRLSLEIIGDGQVTVGSISALADAGSGQLSFCVNKTRRKLLLSTRAAAVITTRELGENCPCPVIVSENPELDFVRAAQIVDPEPATRNTIHPSAIIGESAIIGSGVSIGAGAVIEDGVVIDSDARIGALCFVGRNAYIGQSSVLSPSVVVHPETIIGKYCLIGSGTVIGSRGFGLVKDGDAWIPFPQRGRVIVGDSVELGANCCVDRGALQNTIIGEGVKTDNLVQIAHNVVIGRDTVMAGCTAIAGSTVIGDRCQFGGRSGALGHLEIGDEVMVAALSTMTRSAAKPGMYSSIIPALPVRRWRRILAVLVNLDELRNKLLRVLPAFHNGK